MLPSSSTYLCRKGGVRWHSGCQAGNHRSFCSALFEVQGEDAALAYINGPTMQLRGDNLHGSRISKDTEAIFLTPPHISVHFWGSHLIYAVFGRTKDDSTGDALKAILGWEQTYCLQIRLCS